VGEPGVPPRPRLLERLVVRRFLVLVAMLVAALAVASPARAADPCGIPTAGTQWVDFADGSVPFWGRFAQPGVIAAASNLLFPPQLRAAGAHTIYWDMYLNNRVGNTIRPADPSVVEDRANRIFYRAVASSGCAFPWMALNELFGANTTTPWTPANARYRANVLTFVRTLAARGAKPFVLVPTEPYAAGEALDWWRQVAAYAYVIPEVYFAAPQIHKLGPTLGSRRMRGAFRQRILDFVEMGVPPSRIGIFLGFQVGRGTGGREGLERMAWFRNTKLQALAARQVASELKIHSIWSWGWGHWSTKKPDPDKEVAACVYLWTRNPSLCDGPGMAGPEFNDDLSEGQITALPRGVVCEIAGVPIGGRELTRLTRLTGDRQAAFTALSERVAAGLKVPVAGEEILAAERSVIRHRFGGSRAAYQAALARMGASVTIARGVITDELREAQVGMRLPAQRPTGADVGEYFETYGNTQARSVEVKPAPSWLGSRTRGVALSTVAPAQVFSLPVGGKPRKISTREGVFRVRALGEPQPLATFPLARARAGVYAALMRSARAEAYERWLLRRQKSALDAAVCRRDLLPMIGTVDLTNQLPFLELTS
jgi:hypothetical protein